MNEHEPVASSTSMRTHRCGELRSSHVGMSVRLCGWVARRREHGEHLAFIDLRDHSGVVQCVVDGSVDVRSEYVIAVSGVVRDRPEGTANPRLATGAVEVTDCSVEVLSAAEPPPFLVDDRVEVDESVRLRYRFIDLRRPRMQANLRLRARVNAAIRAAMERHGFCEVETPLLWAPTPEGAREFAVPSRLHHGSFYVLPQSPQLAKQLLMVGGLDRYYQIARCLRDEDQRADRQYEFTQLDLEASFVGQDDIMGVVSDAVIAAARAVAPDRPAMIERMTWEQARERFGTDKPDLRFGMEIVDLTAVFEQTAVRAFAAPAVKAIRVPGGAETGRARLDALVAHAKRLGASGLAWFRVLPAASAETAEAEEAAKPSEGPGATGAGPELAADAGAARLDSPLERFLSAQERHGILSRTGSRPGDLVLVVADDQHVACSVLGALRTELGGLGVAEGPLRFAWVVDFPMFEGVDEAGNPVAAHHPFTMPHPEDLEKLEEDPLGVRALAYDLVLNGWELGSGSVRIHKADVQRRVFAALGISEEAAERRFGFLLRAFRFGAPPHAGFAVGLDRLVAILAGEEAIREVIAFPKTQSGADPLTGAPAELPPSTLAELGIRVVANRSGG